MTDRALRQTWQLRNTFAQLPGACLRHAQATPARAPKRLVFNHALATSLGLPPDDDDMLAITAGNASPPGATPVAAAYAGHQFDNFVPSLGDGRALLLGEQLSPAGELWDIQLKGSGRTPFSRGGDGRAALGPVLREYLLSESMHALGVPTTRALAAALTGDWVEREQRLPGAVLTRVASSHLRVGNFQYLAARGEHQAMQALLDFAIQRHYPELVESDTPALALLSAAIGAQASLIADWMSLGFIHGVMNTDNCSIAGLTIDYGPCAFLDEFDPEKHFSAIDQQGRYAWQNQPRIALWNLARLAEAVLPLINDNEQAAIDQATAALGAFEPTYQAAWLQRMRGRLALPEDPVSEQADQQLIEGLLEAMQADQADYQSTFLLLRQDPLIAGYSAQHGEHVNRWRESWQQRLAQSHMDSEQLRDRLAKNNPLYLPRNHLVDAALINAEQGDLGRFFALLEACTQPFTRHALHEEFSQAPRQEQRIAATFCGT